MYYSRACFNSANGSMLRSTPAPFLDRYCQLNHYRPAGKRNLFAEDAGVASRLPDDGNSRVQATTLDYSSRICIASRTPRRLYPDVRDLPHKAQSGGAGSKVDVNDRG